MKKIVLIVVIILTASTILYAQSFKETFDSNSLEWTECSIANANGNAIINKGVLTVKSNSKSIFGESNTFFETHCYAPLDVLRPFKIISNVKTKWGLSGNYLAGFMFNYRDNGTFYTFCFGNEQVVFRRYENGNLVGSISQQVSIDYSRSMTWELEYIGQKISFSVNGVPVLSVRYMPMEYSGIGYYCFGGQILTIDDVEFIQL